MKNILDNSDLIKIIYSEYKIKIEEACFAKGFIPKYIILDKTRNIHSYLTFIKLDKGRIRGDFFDLTKDFLNQLVEFVRVQYSQLDRPLFFIFSDEKANIFGVDASEIRIQLLEHGGNDIIHFINRNKISAQLLFKQIKNEL